MLRFHRFACLLPAALLLPMLPAHSREDPAPAAEKIPQIRLRRPIALHLLGKDGLLLVAQRDAGMVTLIDSKRLTSAGEHRIGRRLSDLAVADDGRTLVATDEAAGEAIVLTRKGTDLQVIRRVPVGTSPVSIRLHPDGSLATTALLWARRLAIFSPTGNAAPAHVDLPFAPRLHLLLEGGLAVVADAFGGKLAVVDARARKVLSVRDLGYHNIRGLNRTGDGKFLVLTHQILFANGRPNRGEIQAGNVVTNKLTLFPLAEVLEPGRDIWRDSHTYELGDIEKGAGDPAAVVEVAPGRFLVALAGTDELALGQPEQVIWQRRAVGSRPTALAVDGANKRAFLAETFGDAIAVVDLADFSLQRRIPLGEPVALRPEERGEVLFHDARLSFDAWYSCHSCHTDGHTNGLSNDNFTDGSFGTPKRVLSLLGGKDTAPFAWNGKVPDLETQSRTSVTSTMQGKTPTEQQVRDLAAYLRTLQPPPSLAAARGTTDDEAVRRGKRVFSRQKCAACHSPPTYTTPKTYDVGLRDEAGEKHFNPPSLRGVSQRGPYFHDNRARTLRDVFDRHRHGLEDPLPADQLDDLLRYLEGL